MSNEQPTGASQSPKEPEAFPQPGTDNPSASPVSQPPQSAAPRPYPQQPYGQQAYGRQPYPQQPYGQQQPTSAGPANADQRNPNPYQITHYAAQYGSQPQAAYPPSAYPSPASAMPGQKPVRSPLLGLISLTVLVLSVVAGSIAGYQVMELMVNVMVSMGMTDVDQTALAQILQQQLMTNYPGQTILLNVTGWAGFAAWIGGIVAAATNRGRLWGILTIILGVITPVIIFAVAFAAMGPILRA